MERFPQSAQEAPKQISPETVESITQEELKLVEYLKMEKRSHKKNYKCSQNK